MTSTHPKCEVCKEEFDPRYSLQVRCSPDPTRWCSKTCYSKVSVFTPEEVLVLNEYQASGMMHPFTCGKDNRNKVTHPDGEGILVATVRGWICPFCDYTQNWAHDFMKHGLWKKIEAKPK